MAVPAELVLTHRAGPVKKQQPGCGLVPDCNVVAWALGSILLGFGFRFVSLGGLVGFFSSPHPMLWAGSGEMAMPTPCPPPRLCTCIMEAPDWEIKVCKMVLASLQSPCAWDPWLELRACCLGSRQCWEDAWAGACSQLLG